MTAPGEERYALGSPPILAIVIGFVHTVAGVVVTLLLVAYGARVAIMMGYSSLQGHPVSLKRYVFLVFVGLVSLPACTCASGIWLLRGHPRGRRWTVALACVGILCASLLIDYCLTYPERLRMTNPWGEFSIDVDFVVIFLVYCLFALVVMYLPSVRRFYARAKQGTASEDSGA